MRRLVSRTTAAVEIAVAQLRGHPVRTALVVVGVALAVLAASLLASVGLGVLATGEERFDAADRDLWVTGGPAELSPDQSGPVGSTIHDAHALADDIDDHEGVESAAPIGFEAIYVGTNESNMRLVTGVGLVNTHEGIDIRAGEDFSGDSDHYANSTYEGPTTDEVIVDPRTAEQFDLEPGDRLLVSGSRTGAPREFVVVGIAPDYGRLLGTPTVALHLSELQTVAGAAGTDRASLIAVTVAEGRDPGAVRADLAEQYPDYEVRTNREQLEAVIGENVLVVSTAVVLVVLALVAGVALTANLLSLAVTSQQRTLAALQAVGVARGTLLVVVAVQGLLLGFLGWALAAVLLPPATTGLEFVAASVVGHEDLLVVPRWLYAAGAGLGLAVGAGGAVVAGLLVTRLEPLQQLQR
jgi:putative ABC transport system permease protein